MSLTTVYMTITKHMINYLYDIYGYLGCTELVYSELVNCSS